MVEIVEIEETRISARDTDEAERFFFVSVFVLFFSFLLKTARSQTECLPMRREFLSRARISRPRATRNFLHLCSARRVYSLAFSAVGSQRKVPSAIDSASLII
jgi:hypothetical protein